MARDKVQSILSKEVDPIKLVLLVGSPMLVIMALNRIFGDQAMESTQMLYWETALVFALVFALFSCVFSLNSSDRFKYFIKSLITYLVLILMGILLAGSLSGLSIADAGSFSWLFKLFSFCYLLLISVFNLMSTVMSYIKRQDDEIRRGQGH